MKKIDVIFLVWFSFFTVYELALMITDGVNTSRVIVFLMNITAFTVTFVENKEYLMKKFREYTLKDLQ